MTGIEVRLDLNGFAIRGDGSGVGVGCYRQANRPTSAPCKVRGPGEISGFWAGINGGGHAVAVRDVTLRQNQNGMVIPLVRFLDARGVVANDNAIDGIWAGRARLVDVEASRNGGTGLSTAVLLKGVRLTANGNGRDGIRQRAGGGRRSRLVDSQAVGSGGYDVSSGGPLRLVRTTCERSARVRYSRVSNDPVVVGSLGCTSD